MLAEDEGHSIPFAMEVVTASTMKRSLFLEDIPLRNTHCSKVVFLLQFCMLRDCCNEELLKVVELPPYVTNAAVVAHQKLSLVECPKKETAYKIFWSGLF